MNEPLKEQQKFPETMEGLPMSEMNTDSPVLRYTKFEKAIIIAMIVSSFLTLWAYLYTPISDGDIWFHLLYGKAILDNLTLTPDHTVYSWTPSTNDHIYCAWLGQVFYYLVYKISGTSGIILFRYLAASTLFVAIFYLAKQRKTLYNPVTWFTATLCIFAMSASTLDKPEIISFALMCLLVFNWFIIKREPVTSKTFIYLFPFIILVWANTHGAFIFGCLFLFCIGLGETLNQLVHRNNSLPKNIYKHLLLALFLTACATLATPYGFAYLQDIVHSFFNKDIQSDYKLVQAYTNTFAANRLDHLIFADTAIALILLVFIASLRKKQMDFVPIVSNLCFAVLFTIYLRTTYLWVPVFSLSIVYYANAFTIRRPPFKTICTFIIFLASCSLSGLILYQAQQSDIGKGGWLQFGVNELFAIDEEVAFIQHNYPNATLANSYDHGSYILWKMWPGTKVMMDARYFPYREWFQEYMLFYQRTDNVESFMQKYPFDLIEIKHNNPKLLHWFNNARDWKLVFFGKGAAIFARTPELVKTDTRPVRGRNLENFSLFDTAKAAFNAALIINDWPGADIILLTMQHTFKNKSQQKFIVGLEYQKKATEAYVQKNYTDSIHFMEKAIENKIIDIMLYASSLLRQSNQEWKDKQWNAAIKHAIQSLLINENIASQYNIALMAWQIERMQNPPALSLTDTEKDVFALWRDILKNIVKNKQTYPDKYSMYVKTAEEILEGKNPQATFATLNWM